MAARIPPPVPSERSKFGVELGQAGRDARTYNGVVYRSKDEARYARDLDYRKAAGTIKDWEQASPLALVAGLKYTPDFRVFGTDGSWWLVEVKGVETEAYRIRLRLFKHFFPWVRLVIVKRGVERDA